MAIIGWQIAGSKCSDGMCGRDIMHDVHASGTDRVHDVVGWGLCPGNMYPVLYIYAIVYFIISMHP